MEPHISRSTDRIYRISIISQLRPESRFQDFLTHALRHDLDHRKKTYISRRSLKFNAILQTNMGFLILMDD
jgi:hypothetical protein